MKEIFEKGRKPACDADQPSPKRRSLLKACAYLPTVPLLAMLGGCDGDGGGTTIPAASEATFPTDTEIPAPPPPATAINEPLDINLPPYKTTDPITPPESKLPKPTEDGPVDVVPHSDPGPTQTVFTELPGEDIEEEIQPHSDPGPTQTVFTELPGEPPPAPVNPKKVGIYSLQYNSFKQVSARRQVEEGTPGLVRLVDPKDTSKTTPYEGIESYLNRSLDNRLALLYRAMATAFEKRSPQQFDVSFITAPEFYWNVPFGDFWTKEELELAADLCLNKVRRHVKTLMKKFPAETYGHLVLLPGTIAMLKPMVDPRRPNGTSFDGTIYEAFNHVVCTHNLPLNDGARRPAYMIWPKRTVSYIDYFDELGGNSCSPSTNTLMPNPVNPDLIRSGLKNPVIDCVISVKDKLAVRIGYVASSIGRSYDTNDKLISDRFQNNIINGLPFGIDLCLDYSTASVQKDTRRMAQLEERNFKLDFLLAAGMYLNVSIYNETPHIQYAIRNEGITTNTGQPVEVWKLTGTAGLATKTDVGRLESQLAVDQNQTYNAPEGADATEIPNILDKMNAGLVSIWQLDIAQPADPVVASKTWPTTVADRTIQFIK